MRLTVRCLGVLVAIVVLLSAGAAVAGVITHHYSFSEPAIEASGPYQRIAMEGAWSFGAPGEPVLPMAAVRLLLPPGEIVSEIQVTPGTQVTLGTGYVLEPGQRQYPLSYDGPRTVATADYSPGAVYPVGLHSDPVFGRYRGYGIVNLALFPVEYEAGVGSVSYYTSMDVTILTEPEPAGQRGVARMIAHDDHTLSRLRGMIDNPSNITAYDSIERAAEPSRSLDSALGYTYIIVTSDAWDDYLDDFVQFRTERGQKVGVFTREWIVANYSGADTQTKIRNFIIDAYTTWTPDYVLLVGDGEPSDANGIPARGFYCDAYGEIDTNIASDLYYSALDGDWNNDGDAYYGEIGEEDFYPEVAIGRVACSSAANVTNFVTKTMRYLDEPIVSECSEALMVGELLWEYPDIYGGTYKDEVLYGSSANGYTTVGFPPTMNVGTLYERDYVWSISTLITEMETGMNIVNHLGHCNVDWFMKMTSANIPSFDNDGTTHSLNFCYSQGCYGGSFDNRTTGGSYGSDCFAERFAGDDAGAVAIITNTRYGWGDNYGTNGSSQYFDREFFDAIFDEGIYPIGEVNNDSKLDVLWNINFGANRWCYYELTLFGDPALLLWTTDPVAMNVTHSPTMVIGSTDFEVSVSDGAKGAVEGATVTVYTDDYSVHDTATTGATGMVTLHPGVVTEGTLHVKVTANNHLVNNSTATIIPAAGVYLAVAGRTVDDDTSGDSNGNGDGNIGPGEAIELAVSARNYGTESAYGVTGTLSTTSGLVTLVEDTQSFGDIPSDEARSSLDDFRFTISEEAADGTSIPFTLTLSDGTREAWESNFTLIVHAPELAYEERSVYDPPYGGNDNTCPEPGEIVSISVTVGNVGGAPATGITGTLTTEDPYAAILGGVASAVSVEPDGSVTLDPPFRVSISQGTPINYDISFDLDLSGDWGCAASASFTVRTVAASFADDMESGQSLWTHTYVTGGFSDEWHMETVDYHSSGHSWKFGGTGSSYYGDSCDGALMMDRVCIGANGQMTFWHRMDAEQESSTSAWDCGLVQISTDDGATWNVLYPVGGYSHVKNSNTANPLPEGTPCWSGAFAWRQETFDLSSYENQQVNIRFRFASDGYVTFEGWYIDDINLTSDSPPTGMADDEATPRAFALRQNIPNPFNPVTVISYELPTPGHVRIEVFNIAGRLVTTLVDADLEAGRRTVAWNGTDQEGRRVASGVYLYRMEAGDHVSRKAMVLLK